MKLQLNRGGCPFPAMPSSTGPRLLRLKLFMPKAHEIGSLSASFGFVMTSFLEQDARRHTAARIAVNFILGMFGGFY
jgi:hypothetical protein